MDNNCFYTNLPVLELPLSVALQESNFTDVPSDWFVIISDIKDSTKAVSEGRHNDVNLVAAGSLVACINIAIKHSIDIPFYFGGDGGTMIVPQKLMIEVLQALNVHNRNAIRQFGMEMHIGSLPVSNIIESGHSLRIARLFMPNGITKPLIVGDGLQYAEEVIKQGREYEETTNLEELNLEGLECRWDKIKPPRQDQEIVCFLVEANDPGRQIDVYRDVLQAMENIYGNVSNRHPLSLENMKLLLSFTKLKKEVLIRYGKMKPVKFLRSFINTAFGWMAFRYDWKVGSFHARDYVREVIENTDTLNIDGRLTTVIAGKRSNRVAMLEYLESKELSGDLIFGHHSSAESIITCYIEDRSKKHIHFLDGSDGGYTAASKEFKKKKQAMSTSRSTIH